MRVTNVKDARIRYNSNTILSSVGIIHLVLNLYYYRGEGGRNFNIKNVYL